MPSPQTQKWVLHQDHGSHHHRWWETEDIEVHSKWLDWTWTLGNLSNNPRMGSSQVPSRNSGHRFQANSMPPNFSRSWLSSGTWGPRTTGLSPLQGPWLQVLWSFFSLGSAAGKSAANPRSWTRPPHTWHLLPIIISFSFNYVVVIIVCIAFESSVVNLT